MRQEALAVESKAPAREALWSGKKREMCKRLGRDESKEENKTRKWRGTTGREVGFKLVLPLVHGVFHLAVLQSILLCLTCFGFSATGVKFKVQRLWRTLLRRTSVCVCLCVGV